MSPLPANRVISIGAVHLDTIAHAALPIRPETSTPARHRKKPGGVATNIARTLVRLGIRTGLVGALGGDDAAKTLINQLEAEGIEFFHVTRRDQVTGQYLALHNPDGALAAASVDDKILSEAPPGLFDTVLERLTAPDKPGTIWFLDANLPETMLHRIAGRIRDGRLIANAVSDAKAPRLRHILPALDCVMLNRGEAAALTGLSSETALETLVAEVVNAGPKNVVLTDGRGDVLISEAGTRLRFSPPAVDVIDVTGAGDALTAGIIAALVKGHPLSEAVPYGLSAAALTLSSAGALAEDLSWDRLEKF